MAGATAQNLAGTGGDPNITSQPNSINDPGFTAPAAPNFAQAQADTGGWVDQSAVAFALQPTSAFIDIQ